MATLDPFSLNLKQQTSTFLARLHILPPPSTSSSPLALPTSSPYDFLPLSHLHPLYNLAYGPCALSSSSTPEEFVDVLSDLLEVGPLTMSVAELFRSLLMVLMARWIDRVRGGKEEWVRRVVAGTLLAEGVEEVWPILFHLISSSPYTLLPTDALTSSPQALHPLLLTHLRILSLASPSLPPPQFLSLPIVRSLFTAPHSDPSTRFLAIRVYALATHVAERKRREWEEKCLDGGKFGQGDLKWFEGMEVKMEGEDLEVVESWKDAWVWPVLEQKRLDEFFSWSNGIEELYSPSDFTLPSTSLPTHLVLVASRILLFRIPSASSLSPSPSSSPIHISTPTSTATLLSLSLALSTHSPILLTSPPSSGKTHLITHLSHLLFPQAQNHILTISLADTSLDPKSLLGNYVSSPTDPGKFVWVQGALAKAVKEGRWVVLEDIDKAGGEVLALVGGLAESMGRSTRRVGDRGGLKVPGREDVSMGEGFALFATRTVTPYSSPVDSEPKPLEFPKPVFLNSQKFEKVFLPPPSKEEIKMILEARFESLVGASGEGVGRLMKAWEVAGKVGAMGGGGTFAKGREVGLRDLIKWFGRVESLVIGAGNTQIFSPLDGTIVNPVIQEEIFIEACDVFFGSLPKVSTAGALTVGNELGLNDERTLWCLERRRPELILVGGADGGEVKAVRIGRGKLACKATKQAYHDPTTERPFALTRPSLLLLEQISVATSHLEPVLLVGETGTGKTTAVSHLSSLLRRPLISLNLSTQTESSDLLGGFKPLDPKVPAGELLVRFGDLFGRTFSRKKNKRFEDVIRKAVGGGKWSRCVEMWGEAGRLAMDRLKGRKEGKADGEEKEEERSTSTSDARDADPESASTSTAPRKRRKVASAEEVVEIDGMLAEWDAFTAEVADFDVRHVRAGGRFVFSFVEGPLVRALRKGDWVLLDEVNLASPETLESLASVLESSTASVVLTERGDLEPVVRHPDFRLFACMNPATDVGKKDLPPSLRSRFTEIYVPSPDSDREALLAIVTQYIGDVAVADRPAILDVAELYFATKSLAEARELADGSNHPPHYSMRTLARALTFAADVTPIYGLRRSLWEGFLMSFTMLLDVKSAAIVRALAEKHILGGARNPRAILAQMPGMPAGKTEDDLVRFGPFWLQRGPKEVDEGSDYVLTPSVQAKLVDLARVISSNRFPVLIQGPTSSGKTSAVEYLARRTGHRFVRINNHEHTDIQEYLGTYVSDPDTGKLVFQEGVLVRAVRRGDWIVLDELNLAPTDVLEALNRLLDDNRELVIPETQEVIRPHPHFMLFATQNPPGLYGGRKVLSRAFRNRFLEVHFDDVPQAELETILCQRCKIAPSFAKRIVSVFQELQHRRQAGRVFETKQSFATLRDLFRWAGREAIDVQKLAENGYMLLAERARRSDDKIVVKEVLEQVLKVQIDEKKLYDLSATSSEDILLRLGCPLPPPSSSASVVWTSAMQRLYTLVASALRYNEPVLLVGETGCGKTSVCQLLSDALGSQLIAVNCHQNMETADLLGGQKPLRNRAARQLALFEELRIVLEGMGLPFDISPEADTEQTVLAAESLVRSSTTPPSKESLQAFRDVVSGIKRAGALFEWHDGPLIQAMQSGDLVLLDEVSLADDSVLERLNSVLEPDRTLVLAEKGGRDVEQMTIVASQGFQVLATMNPGGDYGKKELSPALRNRFTEIWVPSLDDHDDLIKIIRSSWASESLDVYSEPLLRFLRWFAAELGDSSTAVIGVRDILSWVQFSNISVQRLGMTPQDVFRHAAHMVVIDGLGSLPQVAGLSSASLLALKMDCVRKLDEILGTSSTPPTPRQGILDLPESFSIDGFGVLKGEILDSRSDFSLRAPTTRDNAMRVLRGCQLPKPILLEGSPGVGKTSLITALAAVTQNELCRINLSDQTDLADLFGSDLPVEGGKPGEFAWKDAAFLTALQTGQWVLLDEMNLASQAVLEGLNAVLDHRGTVYLPELGRSFSRHPNFRIFAAQNPVGQGGGRKGLPKSFLNRFTRVFVQELSPEDLRLICGHLYPTYDAEILEKMIEFNNKLHVETMVKRTFGREGSPWEFNLRDVLRWLALVHSHSGLEQRPGKPVEHLRTIYLHRFRSASDRQRVLELFEQVFAESVPQSDRPWPAFSPEFAQFGHSLLDRSPDSEPSPSRLSVLHAHLSPLEAVAKCISLGWLIIVAGPSSSGKTSMLRLLAQLSGRRLREFSMNSGVDTMELLGSFEQADSRRRMGRITVRLSALARKGLSTAVFDEPRWVSVTSSLNELSSLSNSDNVESFVRAGSNVVADLATILGELDEAELAWVRSALADLASAGATSGRFEWVDGELVQAVTAGDWLVIENANLCNASVLDRINSLCETNGSLVLSERGTVNGVPQLLLPHPKFRLFMTLDPKHGELSRAMRNRGVEISLDGIASSVDLQRIASLSRVGPKPEQGSASPPAQLARRAIISSSTTPSPHSSTWDSLITQDSILASILPHGPSNIASAPASLTTPASSSPSILTQHSADISHLLESLSPIASNVLTHLNSLYRPSTDLPLAEVFDATSRALVDSGVVDVVSSLKQTFAESRQLSPSFLGSQPIDPLINPYLYAPEDPRYALASEMVELVVRNALSRTHTNAALKSSARKRVVDLTVLEKSFLVANGRKLQATLGSAAQSIYPLITAFYQTVELSVRFAITVNNAEDAQSLLRLLSQLSDVMAQLEAASDSVDFNYSAIQVIGRWLIDLASNIPSEAVVALQAQLTVLQNSISTDSGGGQREIWLSSLPRTSQQAFFDLERRLVHLVAEASTSHKDFQHLRVSAFQVAATSSLGLEESRSGLETLGREIEEALRNITFADSIEQLEPPSPPASSLIAVAELDVLSVLFSNTNSTIHLDLQEVVKAAQSMPSFPLFDMVAVQHAIWSLDAGATLDSTVRKDLLKSWLRVVWTNGSSQTLTGAADLFRPVVLTELFEKSDQAASKLKDILELDIAFGRVGTVLGVRSRLATESRQTSTTQVLVRMILDLCHAFEASYENGVLAQLEAQAEVNAFADLESFIAGLESTSHAFLGTSLRTHISPALRHLHTQPRETPASLEALGRAWVALSLAFLSLYVPDVPIDPAVAQQSQLALLESQDQRLTAQAIAIRRSESEITGNASNPRLKINEERLAVVQGSISSLGPLVVERETNVSLLSTMFKEIHHFLYQVVDPSRLQELMDLLARSSDSQAFLREQSAQDNVVGFLQRIKETYGLFSDLTQPIDLALSQLRTGLRFLARAAELQSSLQKGRSESELVSILVEFPTAFSIERLHAAELPVRLKSEAPAVAASKLLILEAQAIGYDVAIGLRLDDRTVRSVGVIFDQLSHLWLMDREKEAQAKQEAESLYRQRRAEEEILSDIELEEKEFKELFPQFGDIMDEEEEDSQTTTSLTGKSTAFVRPEQASELYRLHASLFTTSANVDQKQTYLGQRGDVIRDVFDGPYDALTDSLDEQLAFQIDLLSKETTRITSAPNPNGRPYDFYSDANPNEMRKAVHLVGRLVRRLESLSEEWPEQMVLRHLNDRCQAILSMNLNSSIVKVIAAFEGLLLHTADWEAYANRDNTLKSFQADIGDLIVSWRRLELSCWAQLLETQAVAFADGAAVWWFRLYEVLVQGARSAVIEDEQSGTTTAAENHAAGIITLLDQFVSSSPLGQYSSRLRLLRAFSRYLGLLSETSTTFPGLDRISRILGSLAERYTLVEPKVVASLQSQRAKVETSIRDFIKLASWKDVNVHALKASAQHTHRQLHRCIRKFREILRQPCLPLIGAPEASDSPSETSNVSTSEQVPSSTSFTSETFPIAPQGSIVSSAPHLVNLPSTFGKFQQLLSSSIRPSLGKTESEAVNDLAVEIITTSKALADETPGSVTEDTLKILKGLLTRKRRALGDLLKELKRIGLSTNVRPDVLARQQSLATLHALDLLVRPSSLQRSTISSLNRIENYHFRLLITMPDLRNSLRDHHADLLTRELQRSIGFVESTLAVALDNRIRLANGLRQYEVLRLFVDRLSVAGQPTSKAIALVGDSFDGPLLEAHQLMCRIADSLQETIEARVSYEHVVKPSSTSSSSSAALSSISSQAIQLRDSLASIPSKEQKTIPILMDDELDALRSCQAFISSGIDTFQQLSISEPHFRHVYERVLAALKSSKVVLPSQPESTQEADVLLWQKSDKIVNSLLVVAQDLRSLPTPKPVVEDEDLEETPDRYLVDGSSSLGKSHQLLRLPDLVAQLKDLFHHSSASVFVSQAVVHRITPFLAEYALAVESHLVASSSWTGAIYKLAFILSSMTASLALKGFCTPQEAGDTESGEGEGGKTQDGTGMGEGSGAENVSEQIEDESQVEGLQGEENEPQPKDQKKSEGGAIEMSEDFGGELEDVSADGSDEEEDEGEEDGEESPPDEQIGDVDPLDENAVDEKLWGDEKGDDSDQKDEKLDQDHSTEQSKDSEMVAKENETPQQRDQKEKPEADPQTNEENPDENENGEEQEQEDPEGEEEPRGQGEKMPDHVPEADTLDLPDTLDLGEDDDKSEDGGMDMPDDPLADEIPPADENAPSQKQKSPEPDEFPSQPEGEGDDAPEPTLPEPGADDPTAEPEETDATDPAQAEAGEEDIDMEEEAEPELHAAKPKVESGNDTSDAAAAPEEVGIETGQEEAPTEQEDGAKDEVGKQADASTADRQDEGGDNTQDDSPSEPPPNATESRGGQGETVPMENAPDDDAPPPPKAQDTNPLRNLGDALKEIRRRFEQIEDAPEEAEETPNDPAQDKDGDSSMQPAEVEYARDDEDEEMQALGPAPDDQVQDLSELRIADDEQESKEVAHDMEIDEDPASAPEQTLDLQAPEQDLTAEKALTETQLRQRGFQQDPKLEKDEPKEVEEDEPTPLTEEEAKALNEEVEVKTKEWINSDRSSSSAEDIWRLYTSLTHDLSHSLCEQLRLILEPTLATRLKGDYRTGKRLNMKKIVPYVASEFTKDKIWLRRTRPSSREYQVLVSLDDSKSMAESHSVHLAYETLALVSQALTKLEVGDLGIASFGTDMEMVHPLDGTTFSDQTGANVLSRFKFDQKATNVLLLVERSLAVLAEARQRRASTSSTSADLWQLQIILSDGICQSHDELRTLLRKAAEQRVMIVFILIDSLHRSTQPTGMAGVAEPAAHQRNSILSMQSAKYEANAKGQMELVMERYLDTFPFETYVVLRDVSALPEVLSGVLRQWMERIAEQ